MEAAASGFAVLLKVFNIEDRNRPNQKSELDFNRLKSAATSAAKMSKITPGMLPKMANKCSSGSRETLERI